MGFQKHFWAARIILPPPHFPEASRQLKLVWGSLPVQGLEQADRTFSNEGFLRVIKRESTLCQKSPAQISDRGLFCAHSSLKRDSLYDSYLLRAGAEKRLLFVNSLRELSFVSRL